MGSYKFNPFTSNLDLVDNIPPAFVLQGNWNASTNSPTLTSGVGTTGYVYTVNVVGSTNLDGETNWNVGDELYFTGSVWQKVGGIALWSRNGTILSPVNAGDELDIGNATGNNAKLLKVDSSNLFTLTNEVSVLTDSTSSYPPAQNDTYVKSTNNVFAPNFYPYFATDPTKSLIGLWNSTSWVGSNFPQRFHIDLGSSKVINRIYYENLHTNGGTTNSGAKNCRRFCRPCLCK